MYIYIYICIYTFIYVNKNKCVKKINYFVFNIHQVNNHEVFRRWFIETDVKHFKRDAL